MRLITDGIHDMKLSIRYPLKSVLHFFNQLTFLQYILELKFALMIIIHISNLERVQFLVEYFGLQDVDVMFYEN